MARLSDPLTLRPWPSFVDALSATLLVLVFLITLLSVYSGKVLDELEGQERARSAQSKLDDDLAAALRDQGVRVEAEGVRLRVSLPEAVLFESGSATPSTAGRALVAGLGRELARTTTGRIAVEGHTDDRPIHGALAERYPTNWELSTARAAAVVRVLQDEAGLPPGRLEAIGLADTRPVAANDDEVGRAVNRRIELRVEP